MAADEPKPFTLASLRSRRPSPAAASARSPERLQTTPPVARSPQPQLGLLFAEPASPEPSVNTVAETPPPPASTLAPPAIRPAVPAAPPERRVWSVRSLVNDIRLRVEGGYTDLWVEGEVSNCRPAPSGHIYLTLKDGEAQLPVVLFRREAQLLRFRPVDGLAVLVRGRLSIYETRGQLQLIADTMEPRGAGALRLAFEQLKARLLAEGLFDSARKRPLPAYPKCLGIITSPGGAVIRDIVTVVRRRHGRLNLLVHPAVMQGASCPASVARALRWFNRNPGRVELVIIARGGGSLEDLAGFNDEALARAIAASELPVVSAIGHETDFTIADLVADLRAPTPSAAAEIVTAAQHRVEERIEALRRAVLRAGRFHLLHARERFARLSAQQVLSRVHFAINRRAQRADDLRSRMEAAGARRLRQHRQRLDSLAARLRASDPAARLLAGRHRLTSDQHFLERAGRHLVAARRLRLDRARMRLDALSPVAVLARGYALVYAADGSLLRSTDGLAPGTDIRARLAHGSLSAQITEITPP